MMTPERLTVDQQANEHADEREYDRRENYKRHSQCVELGNKDRHYKQQRHEKGFGEKRRCLVFFFLFAGVFDRIALWQLKIFQLFLDISQHFRAKSALCTSCYGNNSLAVDSVYRAQARGDIQICQEMSAALSRTW